MFQMIINRKNHPVRRSLLAKREIDGFETPLSRLIWNVVEQFILPASKVPGPGCIFRNNFGKLSAVKPRQSTFLPSS